MTQGRQVPDCTLVAGHELTMDALHYGQFLGASEILELLKIIYYVISFYR